MKKIETSRSKTVRFFIVLAEILKIRAAALCDDDRLVRAQKNRLGQSILRRAERTDQAA